MLWSCYLINFMFCEKARLTNLKNQVLFIHSTIEHWADPPTWYPYLPCAYHCAPTPSTINVEGSVYCRMLICLECNDLNSSYFLIIFSISQSPFLLYLDRIYLSTTSLESSKVSSFIRMTMGLEFRRVPFNPSNVFNIEKTMMTLLSL